MIERIKYAQEKLKDGLIARREETKKLTGEFAPVTIEGIFTVDTYSRFDPKQLNVGDRAYVRTDSGNTYRIERSRSRPGMLRFHNEKTGEMLYGTPTLGQETMFTVGKQLFFTAWKNPDNAAEGQSNTQSSPIKEVEVWNGYADALDQIETQMKAQAGGSATLGAAIAQAAVNATRGTVQRKDYRKKV